MASDPNLRITLAVEPACPKCGSSQGWTGPEYGCTKYEIRGGDILLGREWLAFTCKTCGYERRERTNDYVEPPPPKVVETTGLRPCQRPPWWQRLLEWRP